MNDTTPSATTSGAPTAAAPTTAAATSPTPTPTPPPSSATPTPGLDTAVVGAFAEQVAAALEGAATFAMVELGDRLGLYAALSDGQPVTAAELARRTGTHERYVREWLSQQVAVGFVAHDPGTDTFTLPPAHAPVLASDVSPMSLVSCAGLVTGMYRRIDEMVSAFRSGQGLPWSDQDPATFQSTERYFGSQYAAFLVSDWVPAAGLAETLAGPARVADIGCGRGVAPVLLAEAHPTIQVVGYDVHPESVELARRRAEDAGLADRVSFEVNHCHGYPTDAWDVITFFDSFHDVGDPVGAAKHARAALAPDGVVVLVEHLAADDLDASVATVPGIGLAYAASTFLCTPNALSQPVGRALGAAAGETALREVLTEAGFSRVDRVADTMVNMVLTARP